MRYNRTGPKYLSNNFFLKIINHSQDNFKKNMLSQDIVIN